MHKAGRLGSGWGREGGGGADGRMDGRMVAVNEGTGACGEAENHKWSRGVGCWCLDARTGLGLHHRFSTAADIKAAERLQRVPSLLHMAGDPGTDSTGPENTHT